MAIVIENTFWNIITTLCLTCVVSVYGNLTIDSTRYQLIEYRDTTKVPGIITTSFGSPLDSVTASLTAGPKGPILLQDISFYDTLSRFDRERIPERVVHAKGAGALGYFEVTHDITKYTKAIIYSAIGKKTNIAIRFSQVTGESGSSDTVRDPRGFAIKFYTEDGIFDLVGNNTPIFFIRDAILFPHFIHSIKRNPVTHLHDANMFWDFMTLRPETTHQLMVLFSDRGIPDGYRYMHGYGSNTFKLVNKLGEAVYCKFHFRTDQGIRNLPVDVANNLTSTDPDYSLRDLYNAIHQGKFPSWSAYIQVMTIEESTKNLDIAFDVTKIWPKDRFPLIPVGKLVLNANHADYFSGVEQAGFSPNRMIPGIEPSPDKMLQGRLFSYTDTQYHRLGANYLQLPINNPRLRVPKNYERDGPQTIYNQDGAPNYFPNSYKGPVEDPNAKLKPFPVPGNVDRYETRDDDNYSQPRNLWKNILNDGERQRMVENIAGNAVNAHVAIQKRVVLMFSNVDVEFGQRLAVQLGISNIVNTVLK